MNVAPEHEAEFNEWYNAEHIPALGGVTGTLSARRYRGAEATQKYAALYHLASPDVASSSEWKQAADTPWTQKLRPHFRDHLRFEARRYERAQLMADYRFCRVEDEGRVRRRHDQPTRGDNALHSEAHWEFDGIWKRVRRRSGIVGRHHHRRRRARLFRRQRPQSAGGRAARAAPGDRICRAVAPLRPRQAADRRGQRIAMGGGFETALACDIIVAAENAVFALPEPRSADRRQRRPSAAAMIGQTNALGIDPDRAARLRRRGQGFGFVNEVVPEGEVLAAARRWAALILECSRWRSARRSSRSIAASTSRPCNRR